MGQVADTSLRALEKEKTRLRHPLWLQRYLFFRKAKGVHGVHSPLAFRLATEVFMNPGKLSLSKRLETALKGVSFQSLSVLDLASGLSFLSENEESALWIEDILPNRAQWLAACADSGVSLAIDCFDCGLLLRTGAVKEKQYLRQKIKTRL